VSPRDPYDRLRQEIVSGRLQPNERLVEADLMRTYDATRTSVREALLRLAHEGLVEHERNRGAKVRLVGEQEAVEILEARAVLEGLVARKAAEKATSADVDELRHLVDQMRELHAASDLIGMSEFNVHIHAAIQRIADHPTAERLVSALNSQVVRFQYRTILLPGRPDRSLEEHSAIVEAIAVGDGDLAEATMRTHLSHVAEELRALALARS
jgi:DNA-binding GntR family transcriptional regulator